MSLVVSKDPAIWSSVVNNYNKTVEWPSDTYVEWYSLCKLQISSHIYTWKMEAWYSAPITSLLAYLNVLIGPFLPQKVTLHVWWMQMYWWFNLNIVRKMLCSRLSITEKHNDQCNIYLSGEEGGAPAHIFFWPKSSTDYLLPLIAGVKE